MKAYDKTKSESKWRKEWEKKRIFESDPSEQKRYYGNFPFPYVNGRLHLGHGYSFMKLDVLMRYKKMKGYNTLLPFAFHATGEPIVGAAKRVSQGDNDQINSLILSGVDPDQIEEFKDPKKIIEFFKDAAEESIKRLGGAVDWRRKFVTTQYTPTFSKFVEWQYKHLKEGGYVGQGNHPVIYCPSCQSPTGDHDRLEGEGARIADFVLIKFYVPEIQASLVPGTLRPETTYGVTNIFLHPQGQYVKVVVNGESLVVEKSAVIKFRDQQFEVGEVEDIDVSTLFGKYAINPLTDNEVIILPGEFIDTKGVTGVVMSVPAHAPVDYVTLIENKKNWKELERFGITKDQIQKIEPISLIVVEGSSEFPAKDVVEEMGIESQNDDRLKEATKLVYRREGRHGITKAIMGEFEGLPVENAKEKIIEKIIKDSKVFILKEPGEIVICRCGTRNHVKFLTDQWFLKFGDEKWKKKVLKMVDQMEFYPPEAKNAFLAAIDWIEDKACVRRSGLGTPAPWDPEWIIETLADSTIYMAYYIVSKFVNQGQFKLEWANFEVYDYIYLGKGNRKLISKKHQIPETLLKEIQDEFRYYYPFDVRSSGKDLINNHLTFMLFHHAAIFPEKYWPKAVHVNGYINMAKKTHDDKIIEEKMSKSKGNFKTLDDYINTFGADITRLALATAGEGMNDAVINPEEIQGYEKWVEQIWEFAFQEIDDEKMEIIDKWLISKVQKSILKANEAYSNFRTRSAFQHSYHDILGSIRWYLNRRGSTGPGFRVAVETMVKLITPVIPFISEEIWNNWGKSGLISETNFPSHNPDFMDEKAETAETFINNVLQDLKNLNKLLNRNNEMSKITIILAEPWKYSVYDKSREHFDSLMKIVMSDPDLRKNGKAVSKYVQALLKQNSAPEFDTSESLEFTSLNEATEFIAKSMNLEIEIYKFDESDDPKKSMAVPWRPAVIFS